jgi:ParB-like chromosome segregation protein Spo0J
MRQRIDVLVEELLDAGPETRKVVKTKIADQERLIAKFERERASVSAVPEDTLSDDDAASIMAFSEQARAGLSAATAEDRRNLFDLLQIKGTVTMSEPRRRNAVKLGTKHHYEVTWTAAIPISTNNSFVPA